MTDAIELRTMAEKATQGEWVTGHLCDDDHSCNCRYIFCEDYAGSVAVVSVNDGTNDCPPVEEAKANQRWIAAANPSAILDLLTRITALEAEVSKLKGAIAKALDPTSHGIGGIESPEDAVAYMCGILLPVLIPDDLVLSEKDQRNDQ